MVNLIVATDLNGGIGYKGNLLYPIKADLKRFKELTTDGVVIMGRKTWDSLPKKPLPNRINVVLSKYKITVYDDDSESVYNAEPNFDFEPTTFDVLLRDVNSEAYGDNMWVIGGEQIYNLFLPYVDKIYLTKIHSTFEADAFFQLPENLTLRSQEYINDDTPIPYTFEIYEK